MFTAEEVRQWKEDFPGALAAWSRSQRSKA
jgi:hypothetical protein